MARFFQPSVGTETTLFLGGGTSPPEHSRHTDMDKCLCRHLQRLRKNIENQRFKIMRRNRMDKLGLSSNHTDLGFMLAQLTIDVQTTVPNKLIFFSV